MAISFGYVSLTARAELLFTPSNKKTLISLQCFLEASTHSLINNTISIYDEFGVLLSQFTVETTTELVISNSNLSKLVFHENTDLLYTIHVYEKVQTFKTVADYEALRKNQKVLILPILFGSVGI
jgi:hypothetical protein